LKRSDTYPFLSEFKDAGSSKTQRVCLVRNRTYYQNKNIDILNESCEGECLICSNQAIQNAVTMTTLVMALLI